VNAASAVAVFGALILSWAAARRVRRYALRTAAGQRFVSHPATVPAVGVLTFFITVSIAAPLVAPYDPLRPLDTLPNHPPSWDHWLGTDALRRDLWSRVVFGSRVSLVIGTLSALLAVTAGAIVGAVAGYWRRWTDAVLMRLVDVGLALPRLFLLIVVVGLWGRLPIWGLVLLIGLTGWFGTSRLVRAEVITLRERAFVEAARAAGASGTRVVLRHILPNVAAPIMVSATLGIGHVLLLEAGLSFLGLGVGPPTPSWGRMIAEGNEWLATAPWTTLWPGLAIALVVMACNALGDGLRNALDPRMDVA
jgi:peptide/nickel transport system permease protein